MSNFFGFIHEINTYRAYDPVPINPARALNRLENKVANVFSATTKPAAPEKPK